MPFFHQITKFFGEKCARNQTFHMKWNQNALKYCTLILISSLEQKEAIFNVKYEIVLRIPYSKAQWGGWLAPKLFPELLEGVTCSKMSVKLKTSAHS